LEVEDDPVTRGMINFVDGYSSLLTGQIERGRDRLQQALAASDDFEVRGDSMLTMSWLNLVTGDSEIALSWAEKFLALAESCGDSVLRAQASATVGACLWRLGHPQRAEQLVRQALHRSHEVNDVWTVANELEMLAWFAASRHEPRRATV